MAVKKYNNNAWEDAESLKKYDSATSTWVEADIANAYKNNAWEEVWSSKYYDATVVRDDLGSYYQRYASNTTEKEIEIYNTATAISNSASGGTSTEEYVEWYEISVEDDFVDPVISADFSSIYKLQGKEMYTGHIYYGSSAIFFFFADSTREYFSVGTQAIGEFKNISKSFTGSFSKVGIKVDLRNMYQLYTDAVSKGQSDADEIYSATIEYCKALIKNIKINNHKVTFNA